MPTKQGGSDLSEEEIAAVRERALRAEANVKALKPTAPVMDRPVTVTKPQPGVSQQIVLVTPDMAEQWLLTMGANRRLSGDVVDRLAAMMRDALWVFDGSPIRFNVDGELVDGQHRLWALIEANHSAEFLVVRGVAREAMATMDTGRRRSFSDVLTLEYPDLGAVVSLAAAIQIIYRWEQGMRGQQLSAGRGGFVIPNRTLLDWFDANKDEVIAANRAAMNIAPRLRGVTGSSVAMTWWLFNRSNPEDAVGFFDKLVTGVDLWDGHPILALRNFIVRNGVNPRTRPTTDVWIALFIKSWNAFVAGDEIQALSFRRGGVSPEAYPIPA